MKADTFKKATVQDDWKLSSIRLMMSVRAENATSKGDLLSLTDIILNQEPEDDHQKDEMYFMLSDAFESELENQDGDRTIVVKRMNLILNERECQVLNFTDITT